MTGVLCTTSLIGSGVAGVAIHSPFRLFWNMTDCFNAWRIYERLWLFSFVFLSAKRCGQFRASDGGEMTHLGATLRPSVQLGLRSENIVR